MKMVVLSAVLLTSAVPLWAGTVQTLGAGSAVAVTNRMATFDTLTATYVTDLGNYSEGGLYVTTGQTSWANDVNLSARLDPFHGANAPDRAFFCVSAENTEWTSIRTTNRALIHGVEFLYGNSWSTGDVYGQYPWGNSAATLEWQTLLDGTVQDSGTASFLPMGTVVGFYSPSGFDELQARATIAGNGTLNALALDNLYVMLTNVPPAPTIFGSDFSVSPITGVASLSVWDTIPGCQYRLVYAETLDSLAWTAVTPPSPGGWVNGGGLITFSDSGAAGRPQRFYRVEVR